MTRNQVLALVRAHYERDEAMFGRVVHQIASGIPQEYQRQCFTRLIRTPDATTMVVLPDAAKKIVEPVDPVVLSELLLAPTLELELHELIREHRGAPALLAHGLRPRSRLLFWGPPGNGKTSAASAIGTLLGAPTFRVPLASIVGSHIGETARSIRSAFSALAGNVVLVLDEIDAIGSKRGSATHAADKEFNNTVAAMLTELDGIRGDGILIATTNRPELLDDAIRRRFDSELHFEPPSNEAKNALTAKLWASFDLDPLAIPRPNGEPNFDAVAKMVRREGARSCARSARCEDRGVDVMSLVLTPLSLDEANAFVVKWHRHHGPVRGAKFSLGAATFGPNGDAFEVVGVAIIGRPVARRLDDTVTLEVLRVATDGSRNACSFLYGAAWRAARALGFAKLITYTLAEEGGVSLRAAGWRVVGESKGGTWSRTGRPRVDTHPLQRKLRWEAYRLNLELFPCSGGLAEGLRRAGIEMDMSFDKDPDACDSYEANHGRRPIELDVRDLLRMARGGWMVRSVNLFVADPPCTPYSRAGKRLGPADERDMLSTTIDLIARLQPLAYLIANVPGLDDSNNWATVQRALAPLAKLGYCVRDYFTIDAADYGVPQHRRRPFWFGHLAGHCLVAPEPTHCDPDALATMSLPGVRGLLPWVTVRDAIGHLPAPDMGRPITTRARIRGNGGCTKPRDHLTDEPAKTVRASRSSSERLLLTHERHPISRPDEPAYTITSKAEQGAQGGAVLEWPWDRPSTVVTCRAGLAPPGHHPESGSVMSQPNAIVLTEKAAAILQGFPETWRFCGVTKKTRWSMIGQAMPPGLGEAVGHCIARWQREWRAA